MFAANAANPHFISFANSRFAVQIDPLIPGDQVVVNESFENYPNLATVAAMEDRAENCPELKRSYKIIAAELAESSRSLAQHRSEIFPARRINQGQRAEIAALEEKIRFLEPLIRAKNAELEVLIAEKQRIEPIAEKHLSEFSRFGIFGALKITFSQNPYLHETIGDESPRVREVLNTPSCPAGFNPAEIIRLGTAWDQNPLSLRAEPQPPIPHQIIDVDALPNNAHTCHLLRLQYGSAYLAEKQISSAIDQISRLATEASIRVDHLHAEQCRLIPRVQTMISTLSGIVGRIDTLKQEIFSHKWTAVNTLRKLKSLNRENVWKFAFTPLSREEWDALGRPNLENSGPAIQQQNPPQVSRNRLQRLFHSFLETIKRFSQNIISTIRQFIFRTQ